MKVQILLSTYNGEKFISEQLDSILSQTIGLENIHILIRDDGSADSTVDILKKYKDMYKDNIDYYSGNNLGACGSFFDLVKNANMDCEYFAFSDQDDVWLDFKLGRAISFFENNETPMVYGSKIEIVDRNLVSIKGQRSKKVRKTGFGNALIENIVAGCSAVINRNMLELLKLVEPVDVNDGLFLHDWTLYMLATSNGALVYDDVATLLYRQHGNNVLGAATGIWDNYKRKYNLFKKYYRLNIIEKNIRAFYNVYGEMLSDADKNMVELFLNKNDSLVNRIKIVLNKNIFRQRRLDDIIFRIMILLKII